jgi:uncharacterized SAM-binding protein YcdF (DUF218 family)
VIRIIPGEVSSTRGEAIAIATFLQQNPHIKSIILVSSPSHMRRATMVFRRTFRRRGVLHTPSSHTPSSDTPSSDTPSFVIIPRASKYSDFQEKRWWKHRDSAIDVASEYVKLVFSR